MEYVLIVPKQSQKNGHSETRQREFAFNEMEYRQIIAPNEVCARVSHYVFPFKYLSVEFVLNVLSTASYSILKTKRS